MDNKKFSILFNSVKKNISTLVKRFSSSNKDLQNGLIDLQKYYFLKKIKSDTEIQILRVSQFLSSFPKNYNLITNIEKSNNNDSDLSEIINMFKLHQENKDKKEIIKIKNFFVSIGLHKLFEFPNYNDHIIQKLIIYCCINSKIKLFKENSLIYNVDDTFDKYYIMIKGKIGKFKIVDKISYISGFNYFQIIYGLYIKKENYLLKLILEKNYKLFPIDEDMMENLNIKLAKYIIKLCEQNKDNINIFGTKEEILKTCYINSEDFEKMNQEINDNINNSLLESFSKTKNINDIHIYEYIQIDLLVDKQILETYNSNDILNTYKKHNNYINYEYNITPKRKFALKALSDTYICYFDLQEFIYYFIEVYKLYMTEQANFLINNYIFQKIQKHFESHYFEFFEFEEVKANQYLFKENDPVEYLYLLKNGIVELTINKNIFKIHHVINQLSRKEEIENDKDIGINISDQTGIHDWKYDKQLNEDKNEKLVILVQNEIIGLECLYLGINYFYNAKIGNKNARFYKIKKDKFLSILEYEHTTGINLDYKKEAERKINFFLLRLINLTKVKINCIKSKKIHNLINKYNQINLGRNTRKVKLNLSYKKESIKLNLIDIYNKSINKNKNRKSRLSIVNRGSIFLLTNSENRKINKTEIQSRNSRSNIKIKNVKNLLIKSRNNTETNLDMYSEKELLKNYKSTPKINVGKKSVLSLKNEINFMNRLNQRLSNDNLFLNQVNSNNNKFQNLQLKENIKTLRNNNSYNEYIYENWKTYHLNINIDYESYKKRLEKINWYKNIDKFPYNTEENKETKNNNKLIYAIQVDNKKVAFIKDKFFGKNNSFKD